MRFFRTPFADSGNKQSIPDDSQPDGSVSFTDGWTDDYEKDQETNPDAKDLNRENFNGLFNDITDSIAQLQSESSPIFITSEMNGGQAYSYKKDVLVRYTPAGGDEAVYVSLVDNNTETPDIAANWALLNLANLSRNQGAFARASYNLIDENPSIRPTLNAIGGFNPAVLNTYVAVDDTSMPPTGDNVVWFKEDSGYDYTDTDFFAWTPQGWILIEAGTYEVNVNMVGCGTSQSAQPEEYIRIKQGTTILGTSTVFSFRTMLTSSGSSAAVAHSCNAIFNSSDTTNPVQFDIVSSLGEVANNPWGRNNSAKWVGNDQPLLRATIKKIG